MEIKATKEVIENMKLRLKESEGNENKEKVLFVDWLDDSVQYINK